MPTMLHKITSWRKGADYHLVELLSGSSIALLMKVIGASLAFGFNVVLARFLGAEGTGQYYLAFNAVTVAVVFGRMGLDKAVMRFVAANADTQNWQAVKGIQRRASVSATIAAIAVATILYLIAPWLANSLFQQPQLLNPLRWMSLAILPMTLNFIYVHLLKGRKQILQATFVENVMISAVALTFFIFLGRHFSVTGATWAYVTGVTVTFVLALAMWHRSTPELRHVSAQFDVQILFESSRPLFWVALTTWIISYFGEFALGIWGSADDVGVFGAATRTALLITFALMAVNSIAAPQFAALYAQEKWETLAKSAKNAMRLTALAAAAPTLVCIAASNLVMSIFGSEFVEGGKVLIIVALAQFVNAATGPVELLLMMSGKERVVRTNVMIIGVFNIFLYVILAPLFGAVGAAFAFAAGLVLKNVISVWLVKKYLSIELFPIGARA